jgi:hypothetical protein
MAGNNQTWGMFQDGWLNFPAQKLLSQVLSSDVNAGKTVNVPDDFINTGNSVGSVCYGALNAIVTADAVLRGYRAITGGTLVTDWNLGPADGSKAPNGPSEVVIPKVRPTGNTFYGYYNSAPENPKKLPKRRRPQ